MQLDSEAVRVTIYVGERDRHQGASLHRAILEYLRREGAAGATVTRALAGFGARSRIHTAGIEVLSSDLPIRIEWIDLPQRVERLLPGLRQMVNDGLIIQERVMIVHYSAGHGQQPLDQPTANVMREEVTTASPSTPVAEVVTLLIEGGLRSLPIVGSDGRLAGIITDGDLLKHAGLTTRVGLQNTLPPEQVAAMLADLRQSSLTAAEIMTTPVLFVRRAESLRTAVTRMVEHDLKRLPVVDEKGGIVGMVSRIDIFRAVQSHPAATAATEEAPRIGGSVAELMYTDTPTVTPTASLEEVVRTLEASHRRRVVVVDADRHVLGIITDGDLLRRSQMSRHPGLLARLRSLIVGAPAVDQALPDSDERAAELMTSAVITIEVGTPLAEALHLMTMHGIKRLPVVDGEGRLVGLLGRASVLRGLLAGE